MLANSRDPSPTPCTAASDLDPSVLFEEIIIKQYLNPIFPILNAFRPT